MKRYESWLERNAFNVEEGVVWVAVGNTYPVKDIFKDAGWRYCSEIGWHGPHFIPSEEFSVDPISGKDWAIIMFDVEELTYFKNGEYGWVENVKDFVEDNIPECCKQKFEEVVDSKSEYMGAIGERLRKEEAILVSCKMINGEYGSFFVYTFTIGDNELVWFTSSSKDFEDGDAVLLSGTVKEHKEFRGVKQTVLSRCLVKAR